MSDLPSKHVGDLKSGKILVAVYNATSTNSFNNLAYYFFSNDLKFDYYNMTFSTWQAVINSGKPIENRKFSLKIFFNIHLYYDSNIEFQPGLWYGNCEMYVNDCHFATGLRIEGNTRGSNSPRTTQYSLSAGTHNLRFEYTFWFPDSFIYPTVLDLVFNYCIAGGKWSPMSEILTDYPFLDVNTLTYLLPTDISKTDNSLIMQIKNLEKTGKVLYLVYSATQTKSFDSLKYIFYRNSPNYTKMIHLKPGIASLLATKNDDLYISVKLFFYITINTASTYTFQFKSAKGSILFVVNGITIVFTSETFTRDVTLTNGTFLVYIERYHNGGLDVPNTYRTLEINIKQKNEANTSYKNIDSYITTNYTPITNANTTYTNATTRFCKPDTNLYTLDTVCSDALKNSSILNATVNNDCFNPIFKKGTDGLLNEKCASVVNNTDTTYNTDLKNTLQTSYNTWANKVVADKDWTDNIDALNQYITNRKPTQNVFPFNSNIKDYCESNLTDEFDAKTQTYNNFCNTIYNRTYTGSQKTLVDNSINAIKTNYCTKVVDGKSRYETDQLCAPLQTSLLKDSIEQRCIKNGNFQYNDKWCKDTSDTNINNTSAPFVTMTNTRNTNLKTNITATTIKEYENNKFLTDDNYNYAIGLYPSVTTKNINDDLLNNKLFDYCENIEPNYPTNSNSQCKGIYDIYKDNIAIKDSRNKMRDLLCIKDNNILTDNADDNTTNIYKCKTVAFDTKNVTRFAPAVNKFCDTDNNINTPECRSYYDTLEQKVAESLNLSSASSFENKISSFTNPLFDSTKFRENAPSVNAYCATDSNMNTTDCRTYYTNIEGKIADSMRSAATSSFENKSNFENNYCVSDSDNTLFIVLLFIFLIVFVLFICKCCSKKINKNNTKLTCK